MLNENYIDTELWCIEKLHESPRGYLWAYYVKRQK